MKWSTAVRKLDELAAAATELAGSPVAAHALPVTQLWAAGALLGPPRDDWEWITVAVVADLPRDEVAWGTKPAGAEHWENATRAAKNPIACRWRSARGPVWNHEIVRPALVWDRQDGVLEVALAALREGRGEQVRLPAPDPDDARSRLRDDLGVSLRAVRTRTAEYENRRWGPGKITPYADALQDAVRGYLEVFDALSD